MSFTGEVVPDEDWAEITASRFEKFVGAKPDSRVCLPTGVTTEPFYGIIAKRVDLNGLTIFLLDEFGGLPLGDPGRCETMIASQLLESAMGNPLVHVPNVDSTDLNEECRRYQSLIEAGGFDLAIVGLGANGHIGMNEPGSTVEMQTRIVNLAKTTTDHAATYGATSAPTWGMTVGLDSLLEASEIWMMVTGSHKSEILRRTVNDPIGPDLPATFLREHPNCTVFADESASSS